VGRKVDILMNWLNFWMSILFSFSTVLLMAGILFVIAAEKNRTLLIGMALIAVACVLLSLAIGLL
jgi:hypothetical protein